MPRAKTPVCPCGDLARVVGGGSEGETRCERCGFTLTGFGGFDVKFRAICKRCHVETDKLYGLFVPHLCSQCRDETVEEQKKTGRVCGICGSVYLYCSC